MFIPRQQYDALVRRYPLWMRDQWPKLTRKWTTAGVTVTGDLRTFTALRIRLTLLPCLAPSTKML